jgi:hypothetical protein
MNYCKSRCAPTINSAGKHHSITIALIEHTWKGLEVGVLVIIEIDCYVVKSIISNLLSLSLTIYLDILKPLFLG